MFELNLSNTSTSSTSNQPTTEQILEKFGNPERFFREGLPLYREYNYDLGVHKRDKVLSLQKTELVRSRRDAIDWYGWKFHFSFDTDPHNLMLGWNTLITICIKYDISLMKQSFKDDIVPNDQGKQVTIYAQLDNWDIAKWQGFLNECHDRLIQAQVKPGQRNPICKPLNGSNYVTYRYDLAIPNDLHSYKKTIELLPGPNSYNLPGITDPYEEIVISRPNQPNIPGIPIYSHTLENSEDELESAHSSPSHSSDPATSESSTSLLSAALLSAESLSSSEATLSDEENNANPPPQRTLSVSTTSGASQPMNPLLQAVTKTTHAIQKDESGYNPGEIPAAKRSSRGPS